MGLGKKKKEENKGQNYVTLDTAFYSLKQTWTGASASPSRDPRRGS